jgi:hypothetical protein
MSATDATVIGSDPRSITLQYELTADEWISASFENVRHMRKRSRSRRIMQVFLTLFVISMFAHGNWQFALIGALLAIAIATDLSLYLTMRLLSSFWETRWSADLRISDEGARGTVTTQEGGPLTRRMHEIQHSWSELRCALCTRKLLILGFSGSMDEHSIAIADGAEDTANPIGLAASI